MKSMSTMKTFFVFCLSVLIASCARNDDPVARHAGRWLVINYWAEWCKPCREEIPQLNAFANNHQATVSVAAVNFDGVIGDALQQQAKALGITFELMATDPAQLGHWPKPDVLPTTQIVDPDGKLVKTLVGPQTLVSLTKALEIAQGK
jgi:thiol-disulfide isomerase/thioredoxin